MLTKTIDKYPNEKRKLQLQLKNLRFLLWKLENCKLSGQKAQVAKKFSPAYKLSTA